MGVDMKFHSHLHQFDFVGVSRSKDLQNAPLTVPSSCKLTATRASNFPLYLSL